MLTGGAVIYSVLSLVFLLAGTAIVLLAFGRFAHLGWHSPHVAGRRTADAGGVFETTRNAASLAQVHGHRRVALPRAGV